MKTYSIYVTKEDCLCQAEIGNQEYFVYQVLQSKTTPYWHDILDAAREIKKLYETEKIFIFETDE